MHFDVQLVIETENTSESFGAIPADVMLLGGRQILQRISGVPSKGCRQSYLDPSGSNCADWMILLPKTMASQSSWLPSCAAFFFDTDRSRQALPVGWVGEVILH